MTVDISLDQEIRTELSYLEKHSSLLPLVSLPRSVLPASLQQQLSDFSLRVNGSPLCRPPYFQSVACSVTQFVCDPFVTPWTAACQAPLSVGFSRQEYWSGLPFPSPGNLPDPGIEPSSPVSPSLAGRFFTTESPGKPPSVSYWDLNSQRCASVLKKGLRLCTAGVCDYIM